MKILEQFMIDRIEDIADELRKTNSRYYRAFIKRKELCNIVNKITSNTEDIILTVADSQNLAQYFEHEFTIRAIEEVAIYKSGHIDCILILKDLGVM